jgi:4-amino-4-deoxy-L-arabinose transferase-like glycosyltransferase
MLSRDSVRGGLCLVALAGGLLALWVSRESLWVDDEARYAEVAREMRMSGDFLVPTSCGEVEGSYPPLMYWLVALSGALFGGIGPHTAALPSMIAGLAVLFLTYRLGTRLADRTTGFRAGLYLALMSGFLGPATACRADMLMAAFELWAITLFLEAYGRPEGIGPDFPWVRFSVALALACLSKGPQALLVVGAIVVGSVACRREWGQLRRMRPALGMGLFLLLVAPWYLVVSLRTGKDLLFGESFDVFFGLLREGGHARRPLLAYLPLLLLKAFPWSLFLPSAILLLAREGKRGETLSSRRRSVVLLTWMAVVVGFYSLAASKRYHYITLIYPAVALTVAQFFGREEERQGRPLLLGIPLGLLGLLGVGGAVFLGVGPRSVRGGIDLEPYRGTLLGGAGFLVLFSVGSIAFLRQGRGPRLLERLLGVSTLAGLLLYFVGFEGPRTDTEAAKGQDLVRQATAILPPGTPLVLFECNKPALPFNLGRPCRVLRGSEELRAWIAGGIRSTIVMADFQVPAVQPVLGARAVAFRGSMPYEGGTFVFIPLGEPP